MRRFALLAICTGLLASASVFATPKPVEKAVTCSNVGSPYCERCTGGLKSCQYQTCSDGSSRLKCGACGGC